MTARQCSLLATALVLFGVASTPVSAVGQERAVRLDADPPDVGQSRGPVDPTEIRAFFEGLFNAQLTDKKVAGGTVAVVRDGELLYSGGFGFADVDGQRPVDPETTLFRIGSASKLFTWVAIMQQVEAGTISLDDDVSEHIDFEIPEAFGEPIRVWHLMTHTPGFEDRGTRLFGPTELSRRDYLASNIPARVRAPGTYAAYSNYGTSLAGHLVERVTGLSWEKYVERNILTTLGMEFATVAQPLPDHLASHMSTGYSNTQYGFEAEEFETIEGQAPAGAASASAEAMARFMIALLQRGELDGARILQPETVEQMFTRRHGHDDRVNGFGLGFYEKSAHGVRIVGHGGDTEWFHSDLFLMPEENVGVFVSYNTASGGQLSGGFLYRFLEHYYPVENRPMPVGLSEAELAEYAGPYRTSRSSYTTIEKFLGLMVWPAIGVHGGDGLTLWGSKYLPIGADEFILKDGDIRIVFDRDAEGAVTHAYVSGMPMTTFERLGALSSPSLHRTLLIVALIAFALALIAIPYRWYLGHRFGVDALGDHARTRRCRRLAQLVSVLNIAGLIGVVVAFSNIQVVFYEGRTGSLRVSLVLLMLGALATLPLVWSTIRSWRSGSGSLWTRLRLTGFVGLAVCFTIILNHWNLLGWKFD